MALLRVRPGRQVTVVLLAGAVVVVAGTVLAALRGGDAAPPGPPEAIVQGFVEALAEHRYEGALPYLSEGMQAQTIPLTLEVRVDDLERRTGLLRNVRGLQGWTADTRAYASVEAESERGEPVTFGFGLVLEDGGAWRIDELYDLGWKPQGLW